MSASTIGFPYNVRQDKEAKVKSQRRMSWASAVLLMCLCRVGNAGLLDDVGNFAGNALDMGGKVVTAPIKSVANTAKAATGDGGIKDIYQPYRELGRSAGNTLASGADLVRNPQETIYREIEREAKKIGGDPAVFVFDIATFQDRYLAQLANSGAHGAANTLRGQNPFQLAAAPLAGAIRAARERHYPHSRPISEEVKTQLASIIEARTLSRARYAVGKVEITLPNFIGQGNKLMGDDYAVVVDDVIVFNTTPPAYAEAPFWWAHEVMHVSQYGRMGIEKFAYQYMTDSPGIEGEADRKGDEALARRNIRGRQQGALVNAQARGLQIGMAPQAGQFGGQVVDPFVAQCVFPQDPHPVHYMVTQTGRIVAVDPFSGGWLQVGWATPPLMPGIAWTYQTPNFRYAVDPNGRILTPNPNGQFVQIGHVIQVLTQ